MEMRWVEFKSNLLRQKKQVADSPQAEYGGSSLERKMYRRERRERRERKGKNASNQTRGATGSLLGRRISPQKPARIICALFGRKTEKRDCFAVSATSAERSCYNASQLSSRDV